MRKEGWVFVSKSVCETKKSSERGWRQKNGGVHMRLQQAELEREVFLKCV